MSLASDINTTSTSLSDIKTAIIAKGVTPSGNITTYATAINSIDTVNNTTLSATPSTTAQSFEPASPYTGYGQVSIAAVTAVIDANIVAENIKSGVSILGVSGSLVGLNGETVNITPSTSQQIITPTAPANGITQATVAAVDSSIDANITAGNIKDGVSILGVTGTYEGTTPTLVTKTITENGAYNASSDNADGYSSVTVNVSGSGDTRGWIPKAIDANGKLVGSSTMPNFTGVEDLGNAVLEYSNYNNTALTGALSFSALTTISGDSAMSHAFYGCTNLTSVNLSALTTVSGRSGMYYAFYGCTGLTSVDLSALTTVSNEYAMSSTFSGCTGLTGVLDLSALTTVSGDMFSTFSGCTSLTSVDLGSLTTINSSGNMRNTFSGCTGLTGALDLSSLTNLSGSYGMDSAFLGCTGLTSVDLSSLTNLSGNFCLSAAFQNCTGLTSVDLSALTTISNYGISSAFSGCTSLTSVDLGSLTTVNGPSMSATFRGCTALKSFVFSGLTSISGSGPLINCFAQCTGLSFLGFPSLTQVSSTNTFSSMLSGVDGCTVVFPPALESVIGSWTDVTNGFGGTNTKVVFGEIKNIQVSIPQGYTVYFNGSNITSDTELIAIIGNNEVKGIDNTGRAFKYTFVVDSTTTTFTPDISGLVFNEFQLTSNESGVVFDATVDVGSLTIDTNNKVYATAGFNLTATGTKEGFVALPATAATDSSATLNVPMFADSDIVVLDSSNIVSLASGDTSYLSVDTTNNTIRYGQQGSFISAVSVQITLTPPAGTTNMRILTGAHTSTERNYDFGYISLGTQRVTPANYDVKQGVIANGSYLFRDSGVNTEFTPVDSGTLDQTNLVLSIGIAEDGSGLQGDNALHIQPIKVFFW